MKKKFKNISQEILDILTAIDTNGGTGFLVGGCVRDQFFGHDSKDIDIEVFGLEQAALETVLRTFGKVDSVGQSFGVTKLTTKENDFDFNLPRRERKQGVGHQGFEIEVDPHMTVREAGLRRDLTMNAIYFNPLTNEVIDNFGGIKDIENRILRHVSPKFAEDPLRVERLMQFAGRKQMVVAGETIDLCKQLIPEFETISKERHWIEFEKLMRKSTSVGFGLDTLVETGWIVNFPQLDNIAKEHKLKMFNLGQDVDSIKNWNEHFIISEETTLAQMFAILCQNMDNPLEFLEQIDAPKKIQKKVLELIEISNPLLNNTATLVDFKVSLATAKHNSLVELKGFLEGITNRTNLGMRTSRRLDKITEESLTPRVVGQDLINKGWKPSKEFGQELKRIFNIQLEQNLSREELLQMIK